MVKAMRLDRSNTMVTIPVQLKTQAKEKGLNFSKILEEALAKELDTGMELERLKERKKILLRKLEVVEQEIEDCEILLKNKKEEVVNVNNEMDEKYTAAIKTIKSRESISGDVPEGIFEMQADVKDLDVEELRKRYYGTVKE
jgi:post-segregation antitoxin (ccd killing protein)